MNSPSTETETLNSAFRKIGRHILPFVMIGYVAAYLDRINIGFAKASMQPDLRLSDAAYGLGAGMFFIGYFLLEVPSNLALRRLGARRWLGTIMLIWAVLSAMTAFVKTPGQLYVMRFLLGAAEAGFSPGITFYMTGWFTSTRWARAYAWYIAGIPFAGLVGAPLSGVILQTSGGSGPLRPWQWLFIWESVPSILVGILILFLLPNSAQDAWWLTPKEKEAVTNALAADAARKPAHPSVITFLGDHRIWGFSAVYFCAIVGLSCLGFWAPSIMASASRTDSLHNGILVAIPNLLALGALFLSAAWSDRSRKRRAAFSAAMLVGACGLAITLIPAPPFALVLFGLVVATCGIVCAISLFWSLPVNFLKGTAAAAGIAFINSLGNLGGFVSPYVIGSVADHTGSISIGISMVCCLLVVGGLSGLRISHALVDR